MIMAGDRALRLRPEAWAARALLMYLNGYRPGTSEVHRRYTCPLQCRAASRGDRQRADARVRTRHGGIRAAIAGPGGGPAGFSRWSPLSRPHGAVGGFTAAPRRWHQDRDRLSAWGRVRHGMLPQPSADRRRHALPAGVTGWADAAVTPVAGAACCAGRDATGRCTRTSRGIYYILRTSRGRARTVGGAGCGEASNA